MTKKQTAAVIATALTAIASVLTQCPEDPPRTGETGVDDATLKDWAKRGLDAGAP